MLVNVKGNATQHLRVSKGFAHVIKTQHRLVAQGESLASVVILVISLIPFLR